MLCGGGEDMGRPQLEKCKILLLKFNTWKPLHLERKNGFEVPLLGKRIRDATLSIIIHSFTFAP